MSASNFFHIGWIAILVTATSSFAFSRAPAGKVAKDGANVATAPTASVIPTDAIWVERMDGEKSCEQGTAQSLTDGANELKKVGVQVFDSLKGWDGKMRIQMCGVPTGKSNRYLIRKGDLEKAQSIGFREVSSKSN